MNLPIFWVLSSQGCFFSFVFFFVEIALVYQAYTLKYWICYALFHKLLQKVIKYLLLSSFSTFVHIWLYTYESDYYTLHKTVWFCSVHLLANKHVYAIMILKIFSAKNIVSFFGGSRKRNNILRLSCELWKSVK